MTLLKPSPIPYWSADTIFNTHKIILYWGIFFSFPFVPPCLCLWHNILITENVPFYILKCLSKI